jgi:HEAT repeat protein
VRSNAAGALGALGPDGVPAIVPLFEACRDENMYVRGEAVHSLWEIAGSFCNSKESAGWRLLVAGLPTLIERLDDPWWDVRCSAMSVLKQLGPAAKPALPRLQALLTELHFPRELVFLPEWR